MFKNRQCILIKNQIFMKVTPVCINFQCHTVPNTHNPRCHDVGKHFHSWAGAISCRIFITLRVLKLTRDSQMLLLFPLLTSCIRNFQINAVKHVRWAGHAPKVHKMSPLSVMREPPTLAGQLQQTGTENSCNNATFTEDAEAHIQESHVVLFSSKWHTLLVHLTRFGCL